ncbi:UspA [Dillenia turbinata]|uniref:UspA n=1 Tax=Dillenia turbinata TaxID=194707 RepID=A0AAN8VXU2_9MAGN
MASANLHRVVVAVDGSEESMYALKWALDNLKVRSSPPESDDDSASFVILHVQAPPSITTGLNPGAIPFGGPSDLEVPAFAAAIKAHQKRITDAIISHALQICSEKNVNVKTHIVVGDPKEKICEVVENLHADLLVMGSRDFGPIKRFRLLVFSFHHDVFGKCKQLLHQSCSMPCYHSQGYFLKLLLRVVDSIGSASYFVSHVWQLWSGNPTKYQSCPIVRKEGDGARNACEESQHQLTYCGRELRKHLPGTQLPLHVMEAVLNSEG